MAVIIKFHYNKQDSRGMKCTELFLDNKKYDSWYESNKHLIKNAHIIKY